MTPVRPAESETTTDRCTPNRAEEGVDAEHDSNADAEATFPGSSHVTSTGSIEKFFW